jgi:nitrogen fixation protein FixH
MQTGSTKPIDRWIPWMFVGVFALLFAVLGWFTWLAVSTFDGVVSKTPYETGLAYDRVIEATRAQDALGWNVSVSLDKGQGIVARFQDARGQPVSVTQVQVRMQRPTTDRYDQVLTLHKSGEGLYRAPVRLPLAGGWDAIITAQTPHGPYQLRQRLIL